MIQVLRIKTEIIAPDKPITPQTSSESRQYTL